MPLCKEQTASRLNIPYKMSSPLESGNIFMLMIKKYSLDLFLNLFEEKPFWPFLLFFICALSHFIHK